MRLLTLYIMAFTFAIHTAKAQDYNVIKVTQTSYTDGEGLFYYLPRALVVANITVLKKTFIPGPYAEFANRYFGFAGRQNPSVGYEIAKATLSTTTEADPQQLYYIALDKKAQVYIELQDNGIIRNVNIKSTQEEIAAFYQKEKVEEKEQKEIQKAFNIINLNEKLDTIYQRQVLSDSVIVERLNIKRSLVKGTPEDGAREAARILANIKRSRAAFLQYTPEYYLEKGVLETILKKLDEREEAYYKLFTGKTITEKLEYTFYFLPTPDKQGFIPLFKFNPNTGISDSLSLMMETVFIVGENLGTTDRMASFQVQSNMQRSNKILKNHGLAYRISEKVRYKLVWNNKTLTKTTLEIPQLGLVNFLPKFALENVAISFDINTGEINSYYKSEQLLLPSNKNR